MNSLKSTFQNILSVLSLVVFLTPCTLAQQKLVTIKGTVLDSAKAKSLPYATVGLYKANNLQAAIKNVFTDGKGRYEFNKIDTGKYIVFATNAGFRERSSSTLKVTGEELTIDVPAL